jgi:hypothetical protein
MWSAGGGWNLMWSAGGGGACGLVQEEMEFARCIYNADSIAEKKMSPALPWRVEGPTCEITRRSTPMARKAAQWG